MGRSQGPGVRSATDGVRSTPPFLTLPLAGYFESSPQLFFHDSGQNGLEKRGRLVVLPLFLLVNLQGQRAGPEALVQMLEGRPAERGASGREMFPNGAICRRRRGAQI